MANNYGIEQYKLPIEQIINVWILELEKSITLFDKDDFLNYLDASINIYTRNKPGDDDYVSVTIKISQPPYNDSYLNRFFSHPLDNKVLYRDSGYMSSRLLLEPYLNSEQKIKDEELCKDITQELRNSFITKYSISEHTASVQDLYLKQQLFLLVDRISIDSLNLKAIYCFKNLFLYFQNTLRPLKFIAYHTNNHIFYNETIFEQNETVSKSELLSITQTDAYRIGKLTFDINNTDIIAGHPNANKLFYSYAIYLAKNLHLGLTGVFSYPSKLYELEISDLFIFGKILDKLECLCEEEILEIKTLYCHHFELFEALKIIVFYIGTAIKSQNIAVNNNTAHYREDVDDDIEF